MKKPIEKEEFSNLLQEQEEYYSSSDALNIEVAKFGETCRGVLARAWQNIR